MRARGCLRRALLAAVLVCAASTWAAAQGAAPHDHAGHAEAGPPAVASPARQRDSEPARPPVAGDANDHDEADAPPRSPVAPVTEADRAAAFPDVRHVHRERINLFLLADQIEWQGKGGGARWDGRGWIGRDVTRLWFRSDGAGDGGAVHQARAQAFYGRAVGRWWDVLAGVRQDVRPGAAQTWAAFGVQGLAPYWFDVQVTAYVGAGGRTQLEADVEYDLLLTNRLILQPRVGALVSGTADPERGLGAGLGSTELGVRMRYEIRREFAPYLGVSWDRLYGGTAEAVRAGGGTAGRARLVGGVRAWF